MLHKIGGSAAGVERRGEMHRVGSNFLQGLHKEGCSAVLYERVWQSTRNIPAGFETWSEQPGTYWWCPKVDRLMCYAKLILCHGQYGYLNAVLVLDKIGGPWPFCRCVEQINKTNRGDISPEELKERQVCYHFICSFVCMESCWLLLLTSGCCITGKGNAGPWDSEYLIWPHNATGIYDAALKKLFAYMISMCSFIITVALLVFASLLDLCL